MLNSWRLGGGVGIMPHGVCFDWEEEVVVVVVLVEEDVLEVEEGEAQPQIRWCSSKFAWKGCMRMYTPASEKYPRSSVAPGY